jgi:quaternary ammonium compound-resistance protein SugE
VSAWAWIGVAGAVEIAWSQSIKPTAGFTRLWPTLLCLALVVGVVLALERAMRDLPVGTAYVVFTGIGGLGAVALGIALSGDPLTPARIAGAALVIAGVVTLHAAGG